MKLRQQQSPCQCVYVMVQTSRFSDNCYFNSQTKAQSFPSNDTRTLISIAVQVGESLFQPHFAYAKVGVGLLDLCPDSHQQGDLFSAGQGEQSKALMVVFDRINQRYCNDTAFIAKQRIS